MVARKDSGHVPPYPNRLRSSLLLSGLNFEGDLKCVYCVYECMCTRGTAPVVVRKQVSLSMGTRDHTQM